MRLPWQCPTCYAELGDMSYAKMITCPYCGSLLLVDPDKKKFLRIPKNGGWYYFKRVDSPGYIKYGEYEEHYLYLNEKWYLLKNGKIYILAGESSKRGCNTMDEGKVSYLWGKFPFVAPPGTRVRSEICGASLIKQFSGVTLLFLQVKEKIPDLFMEIFKG